jgi:predicted phosphohydrolase
VAYTAAAAARLDPATAAPLPAASVGEVFVARTWTNVRKWRNKLADVEAVLLPGDTILADSLEGGWYRVRLEGKVLGYVYRSTLGRP